MMKNFYLLLLVVFTTTILQAQSEKTKPVSSLWSTTNTSSGQRAFLYEFSMDTEAYADLLNPISLNQGELWDDPVYEIPLPFPFYFMGEQINFLNIGDFGGILFGFSDSLDSELAAAIAPLDTDLIDRGSLGNTSLSPLSYQVMGEPGDQVLVIEWKNAGSFDEMDILGTLDMYISFQVWLYESNNTIIFHYGPSMVDKPLEFYYQLTGAVIGVAAIDLVTLNGFDLHLLEGPVTNPSLTDQIVAITGTPSNGTRYIFAPVSSSIESMSTPFAVNVFPNPVGDILYITCEEPMLEATLFSVAGVPIRNIPGHAINGSIDLGGLPLGSYMLQLVTPQGVHVSPIVKK